MGPPLLRNNPESPPAVVRRSEPAHGEDARAALWLALALFFFYLLTTSGHPPYGDEWQYVSVAEHILIRGRPVIEQVERQADGQTRSVIAYSKFSLGQSLLILPFAGIDLLTRKFLPTDLAFSSNLIVNSLPAAESAATCALLFLLIRLLGSFRPELSLSRRAALAVAATSGVATQMWPASRTLFADNSLAVLLTFAIYALARFRYAGDGAGWAIAAAWAAAMMVLCKNLFLLACPALAAYAVWAVIQRKKENRWSPHGSPPYLIVMAAVPFVLVAALQLWHNDLRYGSVWLSGYHEGRDGEFGFSTPLLAGLYGIFLSSGRSLFLYSPPCLLALIGARRFFSRAPAEAALVAGASLPVVFAYAEWWSWNGGWEWGARFYLFLIPLLMWVSTPVWRWIDQEELQPAARRAYQISLALLIAVSLYVQGLGLLIHPAAYWAMTANEVSVLERPVYEKGLWEIRNDMPLALFVPEFSPLAAHHWLIWATWNRSRLDDPALAMNAPWYSLNPKWVPRRVRPYLGFDFWFYGRSAGEARLTGYAIAAAVLLAAMLAFSILKLRSAMALFP